jgi:hypothetical protein
MQAVQSNSTRLEPAACMIISHTEHLHLARFIMPSVTMSASTPEDLSANISGIDTECCVLIHICRHVTDQISIEGIESMRKFVYA